MCKIEVLLNVSCKEYEYYLNLIESVESVMFMLICDNYTLMINFADCPRENRTSFQEYYRKAENFCG
jgi:hypothetical protein